MATAQFTYAVGLPTDDKIGGATTHDQALSLLQEFLTAHDGTYLGPFMQDGVKYPEYAIVKMPRSTEEALQDKNVELLHSDGSKPFVARIEGTFFDIGLVRGMKIHPVAFPEPGKAECTI